MAKADAAFDARLGLGHRLDETAAKRGAQGVPGLLQALAVDARWDHEVTGSAGPADEISVDAALAFRAFAAPQAQQAQWDAELRLAQAKHASARWNYLNGFATRYIHASIAAGRALHINDHLQTLKQALHPLSAAADRGMVRTIDRIELEIEVARVEAERAGARRDHTLAVAALDRWLGDSQGTVTAAPFDLEQPVPTDNPWRTVVSQRPCAANCRRAQASAALQLAQATALDTQDDLTLSAGLALRQHGNDATWVGVLAGISIPLSHPAGDQAAAAKARAHSDLARASSEQTRLAHRLKEAALSWGAYRAEVQHLETRLLAPVQARHTMVVAARLDGFTTTEHVIRASRDLLEAHDRLLGARASLWASTLRAAAVTRLLQSRPNAVSTREIAP